jgi:hypothetical protein
MAQSGYLTRELEEDESIELDLIGPNTNAAIRGPTGAIISMPGFVQY